MIGRYIATIQKSDIAQLMQTSRFPVSARTSASSRSNSNGAHIPSCSFLAIVLTSLLHQPARDPEVLSSVHPQ